LRFPENHTKLACFFSLALLGVAVFFFSARLAAQDPPSVPAPAQQTPPTPDSSSKQKPGRSTHSDDFLVRGTVFTQEGLSLPGAQLRIRRASEKKFRWETATSSRGEFAVRVKMGAEYEVTVRAKGFQEQSLAVDGKTGERFKDLVFRLQRDGGKKS